MELVRFHPGKESCPDDNEFPGEIRETPVTIKKGPPIFQSSPIDFFKSLKSQNLIHYINMTTDQFRN